VTQCEEQHILHPCAVYGHWPCQSEGNDLIVYDPQDRSREIARFAFPRQQEPPYLCLSDYWRPRGTSEYDVVAMSIVTVGQRASEVARQWFADNRYQDYLYLHGLSVESAEALAEYIHKQVRADLGIADQDARDLQDLIKLAYQGCRYSFGYPACPNLEDQRIMWPLLEPERIGVSLSEEFQLHPEQSTSAIIAHHPQAKYFKA
jgi:5-methyltetrahydrofolate--homocysteine methyltransferase